MTIREKPHRLQKNVYQGEVSVSFTLCVNGRVQLFNNASIVHIFENILKSEVEISSCIVPVYCYMPDHQHLIVSGINSEADTLSLIKRYKQKTGYWLIRNQFIVRLQKEDEGLINVARYIFDNPVRKGLVENWQDYPFNGAIGCELADILEGMA